jgi:hypothetical protein
MMVPLFYTNYPRVEPYGLLRFAIGVAIDTTSPTFLLYLAD